MRHYQRGPTMLESIVAVVILGLLTAVALPRFTDLQRDARISKLLAAREAVLSAVERTHGAATRRDGAWQRGCEGNGTGASRPVVDALGNGSICVDEGRVQMAHAYPAATVAGVVVAAGLAEPMAPSDAVSVVTDGYQAVSVDGALDLRVTGGLDAATCAFSYAAPAMAGRAPALSAPNTAGC